VLAVPSDGTAESALNLTLAVTTDGGHSWTDLRQGYNDGGPAVLDALSPHDIWYFANGGLWHSTDGVHFSAVGVAADFQP
jgi:hypothetical protein